MNVEKILNWMCKDLTLWYIESNNHKEIIYPLTKEKQKIVCDILNEQADMMVYGKNFYTLDKDIEKTIYKTSYMFYLKKANSYKKKKIRDLLPYDIKDDKKIVINKMLSYYQQNNLPYFLVVLDAKAFKENLIKALNPFSYFNIATKQILLHQDLIVNSNGKLIILVTAENLAALEKKRLKIEKVIASYVKPNEVKVMDNQKFDIEYFYSVLLPI